MKILKIYILSYVYEKYLMIQRVSRFFMWKFVSRGIHHEYVTTSEDIGFLIH